MTTPVVIVTRHPDAENGFDILGGEVEIIDIDLGSGFDGEPNDREQAVDWGVSMLNWADNVAESVENRDVFDKVLDIVSQVVEDHLTRDELLDSFHADQS